ncbi:MAG: hypothetical protein WCS03_09205 [Bacteroidota bacterium]
MMKRKLFFGTAFLFIAWAATSCEAISGCKICNDVTSENGTVINTSSDTEYCGAALATKEATKPINIGTQTIKVECR